ncbi:uncharacterized protein LOC141630860 [Silene latifolia]|uniref:uncharacterized protein LOC141630860 n=1 Tax=Silene latifolia TaxID=37657 RepID=UPI003D76BAE1
MMLYDGTTDPIDHVNHYKQKMMVIIATGPLKEDCMCKGFGSTLSGAALQWFVGLPNKSIANFADLVNAFNQQFASSKKPEKQTSDLYRIVQGFEESTRDYLKRFNKEKVSIPRFDIGTATQAFRRGLHQSSELFKDLTMHLCTTSEEVQSKSIVVMRLEEDSAPIRGSYDSEPVSRKALEEKKSERPKPYSRNVNKVSGSSEGKSEACFITNLAGLFKALQELGRRVRWPKPPAEGYSNIRKDTSKTCEFHGRSTHDTDECHSLRKEVKFRYDQENLDHLLLRGITRVNSTDQVLPSPPPQCTRTMNVITVTFDETDAQSAPEQHHDALIITLPIENSEVRKILVDTGSSINLIMLETLKGVGFTEKDLAKKAVPFVGFSGETKHSLGQIIIPTYAGGVNKQALDPRDEGNTLNVPPMSKVPNALGGARDTWGPERS